MALDPKRTVAELRELQELTGNADGAQRVAWTDTWVQAQNWMAGKLDGIEMEFDEARNQWWTLPGDSERTLIIGGHLDSVPNGGWLDGALNVVAGSEVLRRIAEEGRPAGHGPARQLGRRGRRALRPLAVRLERGGGLDARSGRAPAADRRRRRLAPGRDRGPRDRPRPGDRGEPSARERGRLPRAAHRAGAGAREHGPPARGRARHVRGRAPSHHVARPGGARGVDSDGQAPRRARRRREAGARAARDRRPHRRRRRLHDGRRRHEARHRHVGRRDRRVPARPAPPRRVAARGDAEQRRGCLEALRRTRRTSMSSGSGSGTSSRSCSTRS